MPRWQGTVSQLSATVGAAPAIQHGLSRVSLDAAAKPLSRAAADKRAVMNVARRPKTLKAYIGDDVTLAPDGFTFVVSALFTYARRVIAGRAEQ